ncbi:MAG: polysaccharide pyruvyl transferase family protein [Candidatus Peregrinibacteria bacterium]
MRFALVAPYYEKDRTASEAHALGAYAHHLLSHFPEHFTKNASVTVLTNVRKHERHAVISHTTHSDPIHPITIEIRRCFRTGLLSLPSLFRSILHGKFAVVHIQHETFLYGNGETLVLFPLFVGLLRFFTIPITTLHHIVRPEQIDRAFARMNHSALPPMFIRFGYRVFYRLMGILAGTLVVHEEGFRTILAASYGIPPEKIRVIPHGVADPTLFSTKNPAALHAQFGIPAHADTIFGFFGYVSGYKGIDLLLSAFEEHRQTHPHDHLLINGSASPSHQGNSRYRRFFRKTEHRARGIRNVHWIGGVADGDVGAFFAAIDCLVLPYRTCFGQSGPLSYAIGAGKPFLASEKLRPIVAFPELLFSLTTVSLCEKLAAFSRSTAQERSQLTLATAHLRHERTWKRVGEETTLLYDTAIRRARTRPRILLLGAYGQCNLGDDLLLSECLRLLPRDSCVVASTDPVRTEQEHDVQTIGSHRGFLRQILTIMRARTIVIGGGDQFKLLTKYRDRFPAALLLQCAAVTLLARLLRKDVVFLGVGIGNIDAPLARLLTAWTIKHATLVTFRDRESALLGSSLAPQGRSILSTDLAFLSEPSQPIVQRKMLHLGIAPAIAIDHPQQYHAVVRTIGHAADEFLGEYPDHTVSLLPFQKSSAQQNDLHMSSDIFSGISQKHRCRMVDEVSADNILEILPSLDVLWGMRLHSLILATLYAVPFIALVYDVKVRNFLREIDYEEFGIALDASFTPEKLLALQRNLEEHAADIRTHLRAQALKLHARSAINARILTAIARGEHLSMATALTEKDEASIIHPTMSSPAALLQHHSHHSQNGIR